MLLRATDPWWRTHFPPNGWGCRCRVQQLSDDDLERFGFEPLPDNVRPADEGITRPWTNERTGRTTQVPVGINPGWDYNAGRVDPVARARAILAEKAATDPAPQRRAILDTWEDYVAAGRETRREIEAGISDAPGTVAHARKFRDRLRETLRERRGAGERDPEIEPLRPGNRNDGKLAAAVREAAAEFPRTWIEAGNRIPLRARHSRSRGFYSGPRDRWRSRGVEKPVDTGMVSISDADSPGVLHEFAHHLQAAMPALDERFQDIHRARTAADRDEILYRKYPRERGRPDKYVDRYAGREYSDRPERWRTEEVLTMAYQQLLRPPFGLAKKELNPEERLLMNDPEMADLAIGLLMRYDPDP